MAKHHLRFQFLLQRIQKIQIPSTKLFHYSSEWAHQWHLQSIKLSDGPVIHLLLLFGSVILQTPHSRELLNTDIFNFTAVWQWITLSISLLSPTTKSTSERKICESSAQICYLGETMERGKPPLLLPKIHNSAMDKKSSFPAKHT